MHDRADKPSKQSSLPRLGELQIAKFISDALRAGERAILVTGRGQVPTRVSDAALAACASASAQPLHIGPPLPEPPELQEMIGAAVGVAGGRDMTPQAMAMLLMSADSRPTVILAIDDAQTLSRRSLGYLTLMTELLASEAPILQVVLAAGPALLDTLAQPEFERFRDRLCRPGFETFQTLHEERANGALLGLREPAHGRAAAHFQNGDPAALSPRDHGIARLAVRAAAVGVTSMICLAAIGFIAFPDLTDSTFPPIRSLNSAVPTRFLAPSGPSQSLAPVGPGQTNEAVDPLIDETVDAVANGSAELTSTMLERIAKLEASGSSDRFGLTLALADRLAARAGTAAAAGRIDEAQRLEQVFRLAYAAIDRPDLLTSFNQKSFESPLTAVPGPSGDSTVGGPSTQALADERDASRSANPVSYAEEAVPATTAVSGDLSRGAEPADKPMLSAPSVGTNGAAESQLAALAPERVCQRDEDRLAQLRNNPSRDEAARFANELGCEKLRPQLLALIESLEPAPAAPDVSSAAAPGAQPENETPHPSARLPSADVASSTSEETCKRDEERLVRLGSNPSGDEALRFVKELGCEKLLPQLQRLLHSLDSDLLAPPAPADSAHSNPVLGETCASERAALDRLRQEPSAEAAVLFWRNLQCEGLRPQVRLLLESLNLAPDSVGSPAAPGESEARGGTFDTPTAIETSPACRQETAELNRVRATPDLSDAKRFAGTVTCDALRPQVARLLESLGE
jgi:hypothetical protein